MATSFRRTQGKLLSKSGPELRPCLTNQGVDAMRGSPREISILAL